MSPAGYPLADFGERLVAYIIDAVILAIGAAVVLFPLLILYIANLQRSIPETAVDPETGQATVAPGQAFAFIFGFFGIAIVVLLIIRYLYQVEAMFRSGQTIGKRIMKIAVVPLDPTQQLTRGMAVKRFLIESVADSIVPFLFYLDGLWQVWDQPYRQCLHDKFALTVVIKR